jgi:hypothetical protein
MPGEDLLNLPGGIGVANRAQVEALKSVLGLGGTALAVGAGARGLAGLGSFLGRELGGEPKTPQRQSFVRIPVPVRVRSRAERDALLAASREEIDKEAGFAKLAQDSLTSFSDALGMLRRPGEVGNMIQNTIGGWGKGNKWDMPWVYPAGAAALTGGLYGGWKLTDYLLDKTRSAEQESEVAQARKEYEAALAGRRKVAAAGPLDELAGRWEKRGWVNPAIGGLLALGGATALASGVGAYRWTRGLAEDKAIEEAVKRRQAQIAEQSPSPIMAIPTPVPVYGHHHHRSAWEHLTGRGGADALSAEDEARMAEAEAAAAVPGPDEPGKAAMVKESADVVEGRPISRGVANSLGQVGNVLAGGPILTTDTMQDPMDDRKAHERTVADFSRVRPQQLGDVRVRLGGGDVIDDMKRVWANRRTGPIGKAIGTVGVPLSSAVMPLFRGSHYSPWANTVTQYANNQPITQHELGHAINFNQEEPSGNFFQRQLQGTGRDLYGLAAGIPGVNLWHEAMANRESRKALEDIHRKDPAALRRAEVARLKVLPAGYGSYVGGALSPFLAIPGMAAGKLLGLGMAASHAREGDDSAGRHPARGPAKRHPAKDLKKAANVGQAADQVLGRIKSQQMDVWNRMMTPADAKPAKPAKPEPPPPPQLPTLAGKGMAAATGPPTAAKG